MIEFIALAFLGVGLGAFGTLVGAGGGFLLVPVLLFVYPSKDPDTITAMSLLVVFANATAGTVSYWVQRRIDVRTGLMFAMATLPGAIAGALLVSHIPRQTFNLIFAIVLALIGGSLMLPRGGTAVRVPLTGRGVIRRRITDRHGTTYVYGYRLWQGLAISVGVGFVSSLLGIGGGIVHVPAMAIVLQFPVYVATATSHFVLALMALEATLVHIASGTLSWNRTLAQAAVIAAGAATGAPLGAHLSHRVPGHQIIRALGAALIVVAVRLALTAR